MSIRSTAANGTSITPRVLASCVLSSCVLSSVLLAACAPADAPQQPTTPGVAPAPTAADEAMPAQVPAPAAASGTVGGDGSEIQLDALAGANIDGAALDGELACSFAQGDAGPLLYAMGVVGSDAPAQGIVKVTGYVERVRAPGGFDGMTRNPTFSGQGKTIRIEQTGAASGGGESPSQPATLTYLRADGGSRTFEGQWQCGP